MEQSERWENKERLPPKTSGGKGHPRKRGTKKNKQRNIKTENTFSVLQEENTEPLWEEE